MGIKLPDFKPQIAPTLHTLVLGLRVYVQSTQFVHCSVFGFIVLNVKPFGMPEAWLNPSVEIMLVSYEAD